MSSTRSPFFQRLGCRLASSAIHAFTSRRWIARIALLPSFVPVMNRAATIEYQYIRDPVLATGSYGSSHLDIPNEYAMGVCAYAAGHAYLKELNFSRKADEQFALYQKAVQDAKRESRKVTPDSGLVWGRQEPQYGWSDAAAELQYSIPDLLGS